MHEYIDTHSHLYMPQFDVDREEVIERMKTRRVSTILVGVGLETSKEAINLAEKYPETILGATIGVHPTDTEEDFIPAEYEELLKSGSVVGIGECGLDYFRTPKEVVYERQRMVFEKQVEFAAEKDLPLMLHVRPSKGSDDAHDDAIEILMTARKKYGDKIRGNAHFFTGSLQAARKYWELGFTTAFPGVITFAKECEEVVRECPEDLILSETDSPYASPVPHRGERCEPGFVVDTVKHMASIRGENVELLKNRLYLNAKRVFGV